MPQDGSHTTSTLVGERASPPAQQNRNSQTTDKIGAPRMTSRLEQPGNIFAYFFLLDFHFGC